MPQMFSINVTAPSGMNVGPSFKSQPDVSRKVNEAARQGTIKVGVLMKARLVQGMQAQGRHDSKRTRTNAPVGGPPQSVTGRLKNSISTTRPARVSLASYDIWVGPNANGASAAVDVYSTTQQYGMLITARTAKGMKFIYGKEQYRGVLNVYVPARPLTKTIENPGDAQAFADRFAEAIHAYLVNEWYGKF